MIYTSYYANLKNINQSEYYPISICKFPVNTSHVTHNLYELAPDNKTLYNFKDDKDEERYRKEFFNKLNLLNASEIVNELYRLSGGMNVVLICYEGRNKFCHRHIVMEWLRNNGFEGECGGEL